MKKIIYLSNTRLPTERAHGIQILKTCEALKSAGFDIELWVADLKNPLGSTEEVFNFYKIKNRFPIKKLSVISFLPRSFKLFFYLESFSFLVSAIFMIIKRKENFYIYTRDEISQFLSFFTKRKVFWEAHMTIRLNFLAKQRVKKLAGIIAISQSLKNLIVQKYNLSVSKVLVAHDAVDLEEFSFLKTKTEARRLLNLPADKNIVIYTGGMFKQKGIYTLLKTASLLTDYFFILVGGSPGDELENAKKFAADCSLNNVIFTGYVKHELIKDYFSATDILVIPNSNLDERTSLFTSPLKLFEYMSSFRPIIASATPTILEILNSGNSFLVKPDNPESLRDGILEAIRNSQRAELMAKKARNDVENYTWEKRAQIISRVIYG